MSTTLTFPEILKNVTDGTIDIVTLDEFPNLAPGQRQKVIDRAVAYGPSATIDGMDVLDAAFKAQLKEWGMPHGRLDTE